MVVPDRSADVSPPAWCVLAYKGADPSALDSDRPCCIQPLVEHIIANFVYRRKCLNANMAIDIFGYPVILRTSVLIAVRGDRVSELNCSALPGRGAAADGSTGIRTYQASDAQGARF